MPTAPPYLRDQFADDGEATRHLMSRGFKLIKDWMWQPPVKHEYSQKDWDAIDYLIMEWDFGGINEKTS